MIPTNWYGEILFKEDSARTDTCFNGSLWLSLDARYPLNGMLIVGGSAYQVFDLGGGILGIGIIGVQQEDVQICGTKGDGGMRITGDPEGCSDKKLKVLVLYTQAATSYVNNLNSFASLCIAQANGILHNSQVYKNVELAGVVVLQGFVESSQSNMLDDVNTLSNNLTAQSLRSQYKADAVIMLVAPVYDSATNGRSKAVAPAFADCYGLVAVTKALPIGFVFTHELGHLLGARHFIDNHSNSYDHAYNFSKHFLGIIPTMTYRTAVHGFTTEHVIPYLSNPTVTYNGKATGTANKNNNSRKVNENFYTVANFYTEAATLINTIDINMYVLPPPPPPFELLCDKGATAIAGATCGTPPFTHDWYESMNGLSYSYAGTGATWDISQSPGTTFIKLVTTDADNHTATTYGQAYFGCGEVVALPSGTMNARKHTEDAGSAAYSVSPNPLREDDLTIRYHIAQDDEITAGLTDIKGGRAATLYSGNLSEGSGTIKIHLSERPAPGLYLLSIRGKYSCANLKLIIE